ncbi:RHS repeat-associated core domain-containing protein, partial [Streptomyces sp. NPDC055078]
RSTTLGDKQCFTYDGHRRLKSAWTAATDCATTPTTSNVSGIAPYWKSFTYDSAGNRKTATNHLATGGSATTTYTYDLQHNQTPRPHLLTGTTTAPTSPTQPATSYTYDQSGNTLTRTTGTGTPDATTQTLEWGPENTLTNVTEADNSQTSFLNDADGNRLIRRDTTGTTLYLGETELRLDKATNTVQATRYYSHAGQTVAMRTPQSLTWLSTDHNGTANLQIDAATQTVTRRHTQPFGETRGTQPHTWTGDKGFVGGTQDPTGLTHLGARDYDPTTGRFTSADPIADLKDPQQINGYAYSNNNPVTFADPDGKWLLPILIGIIAVKIVRVVAAAHQAYRQRSHSRASSGSSRSGAGTGTGGGHGSGFGGKRGETKNIIEYVNGLPENNEPENPSRLGRWRDLLQGIGTGIGGIAADTVDIGVKLHPSCWVFGDCGEARNTYDKVVQDHGLKPESEAADAGEFLAQVGSLFNVGGIFRALTKKVLKGATARPGGSLKGVNPTGSMTNCARCAIATDLRLQGQSAVAGPGDITDAGVLEKHFGSAFRATSGRDGIAGDLLRRGNGARGIVYGFETNRRGDIIWGHFFNAVNDGGNVKFLDGQAGGYADTSWTYMDFMHTGARK